MAGKREKPAKPGDRPRPPGRRAKNAVTKAEQQVANGETPAAVATIAQAELYQLIYAWWRKGVDYYSITQRIKDEQKIELSTRRVMEIVDELRAANHVMPMTGNPREALRIIDQLADQMDASITIDVQILEGAIEDKMWSAAVGASKRIGEARQERLELLQARGTLPHNLALLQWSAESEALARGVLEIFQRFSVPEEAQEAIAGLVKMRTVRDAEGQLQLAEKAGEIVDAHVVSA